MAKHKIRPLPIADRRFVRSAIGSGVALEDCEAIACEKDLRAYFHAIASVVDLKTLLAMTDFLDS